MNDVVKKLSFTHEAFADYILANPMATLRELRAVFGYSESWLCSVINSDMFQAYLAERRIPLEQGVLRSVSERLRGLSHLAMDRVEEVLQTTNDPDLIVDSFDKIMHRYGYAPNAKTGAQAPAVQNNTQNVYFLDQSTFQKVRGRLIDAHSPAPALENTEVANEKTP